jgi:hypothetical protein
LAAATLGQSGGDAGRGAQVSTEVLGLANS